MAYALPDHLTQLLRHWGPRWAEDIAAGRDAMLAAWAPLLQAAPAPPAPIERDLPYGAHPRQVLDIHPPTPGTKGAPVLVFVHGGAFMRGDKCITPEVYANVAREFAQHGWLASNVEYRLAPEAAWPEGARDVRAAVEWVAAHAARWGGDAQRIFLMGHSAACAHCATAAWDDRVRPTGRLPLAGLVLASPRAAADQRPDNPNAPGVRSYYGDDASTYADRAPMERVRADAPPTFIAVAQYENPLLEYQAFELAHRLARTADDEGGPMPRLVQYADRNHTSIVTQFDTAFNALGEDIRDWCERVARGEFARRPR